MQLTKAGSGPWEGNKARLIISYNICFLRSYVVPLSDVAPVGSFIAEPRASDDDHGPDGDISFSILSGNEDGFFNISAMFGTVTVARSPLIPRNYNLTITATDHGTPPLSSRMNATVVVMVTASVSVDCNKQRYGECLFDILDRHDVGS